MQKNYKPVSCTLYDTLTEAAVMKRKLRICVQGEPEPIEISVQDILTKNGEEFLITQDGRSIRLDDIQFPA